MRRFVALGSTARHDYSFFVPIVCEAWRRVGYEPVVFLVGSPEWWNDPTVEQKTVGYLMTEARRRESETGSIVTQALHDLGVTKKYVEFVTGIEDATIAQSVRLHAAADPMFRDKDLLIPSDADLIPIGKDFYQKHDVDKYAVASYYSNGYMNEPEHFPSCHISAKVETWRSFMGYESADPRTATEHTLRGFGIEKKMADKHADPAKNWGHVWFADETTVSQKIVASKFYPDSFQRIERHGHPPVDRLDRACWPAHYDPAKYTDCHSIRPGWCTSNWFRLRPLVEYLMPQSMWWVDIYRQEFLDAMQCDQ